MSLLTVRHATVYRYSKPVELGEHRMMFRPRESHDLRLLEARLDITPRPTRLRWLHDVFDNSVAIATFGNEAAAELRSRRELVVDVKRIRVSGDLDEPPHVFVRKGLAESDMLPGLEVFDPSEDGCITQGCLSFTGCCRKSAAESGSRQSV